jgi:hypothetical protein
MMPSPLVASFLAATATMAGTAVYVLYKTRGYICTTSMLLGFLLLFYGPAYLLYVLHYNVTSVVFRQMTRSPYFEDGVMSLNFSIAIMYCGCIAGIELADRIAARRRASLARALKNWGAAPLAGNRQVVALLIAVNLILSVYMIGVSIYEDHVGVILGFFNAGDTAAARDEFRLHFSGTRIYWYRFIVASTAPFFLIWGLLEGWVNGSRLLLASSFLLLLLTLLGRVEMLSRAPVAFIILQFVLAAAFCFRNRITWQIALLGSAGAIAIFYPLIELTIPETARNGTALSFFFRRAFFGSDEALLEFFSAVPYYLSHTWGANIRPLAWLTGVDFRPLYIDVSFLWRGESGSISNAMFIADAWADFSWPGVITASVLVGMLCRAVDLTVLASGKSAMTVAVLASMFGAILTLMISSAQTAMLSGGLLSVPLLALGVSWLASRVGERRHGTG